MKPWILAIRPRTLGAAAVPVLLGASLALSSGMSEPLIIILILACAVLIQIGTNLFNDAIDFAKGADTANRLGPIRVTSAGLLSSRQVLIGGALSLLLAALISLPLVLRGGWPILVLGSVSLLLAYGYTGGPFPLAYLGLGEIFVVLFFGLAAVAGTFYLVTLEVPTVSLLAGLQIGLHASVLLAVNNLRDLEGDRLAGKKTLAARFGLAFAQRENATLVLAPFFLGLLWIPLGYFWSSIIPLAALPLAWPMARACLAAQADHSVNNLLAEGARLHLVFGLLLALTFFVQ